MNRNTPAKSTTLVLILLDGSHRVTQCHNQRVDFNRIKEVMKEHVDHVTNPTEEVVWAFLACGQQHNQYTGNEVKEFTS